MKRVKGIKQKGKERRKGRRKRGEGWRKPKTKENEKHKIKPKGIERKSKRKNRVGPAQSALRALLVNWLLQQRPQGVHSNKVVV